MVDILLGVFLVLYCLALIVALFTLLVIAEIIKAEEVRGLFKRKKGDDNG